jgi:hypothetical protein
MKKLPRASHGGPIHSKPPEFSGPFLVMRWWVPYEHMATCPGAVGMGTHGSEAVFRYRTTREKNLFFSSSEYVTIDDSLAHSKEYEPFHEEFAIDPASGAILRLTLEADIKPRLPLNRSDIMVECGPQVLGGPYLHLPQEASPSRDNGPLWTCTDGAKITKSMRLLRHC